jgi:hypothetical protein
LHRVKKRHKRSEGRWACFSLMTSFISPRCIPGNGYLSCGATGACC